MDVMITCTQGYFIFQSDIQLIVKKNVFRTLLNYFENMQTILLVFLFLFCGYYETS